MAIRAVHDRQSASNQVVPSRKPPDLPNLPTVFDQQSPVEEIRMNCQHRLTFSVPEAAKILGVSRAHAYELVARNELPAVRLGRRILVPRHAIETLLHEGGSAA
jgi:excisionase family DNA binding protein